jgi:signal transduction histidine kinase
MTGSTPLVVQGVVDREGRLIGAEPRLLALQHSAGGELGGVLVVPALASLARLARTLGVLVSRGIVVAEGDDDLDLWVRAQADGDNVQLSIGDWNVRPKPLPDPALAAKRARDFAKLEADGTWTCDTDFRLVDLDEGLCGFIGQPAAALAGQPVTHIFKLIEGDDGDWPLLPALSARTSFFGQHAELRAVDGVSLTLHGEPRTDSAGQFCGFAGGYAFDDKAQVAAPLKTDLPAAAPDLASAREFDHALRAPLSRIIANADEIGSRADGPLRQDYADYARDISTAGRHLLGLVDDLADVRTVEDAAFTVEIERIDLADVARKAAGLLAVRASDKGVRVDAPQSDESLPARGDFRRVLQILVNLIGNAVRYSPQGSNVWVRSEEEGDLSAIIVADQGKGIAVEDHDRIFEKFERVDPTEPGGSGLGLFISRRLARAMGGDITVDSAPGMGARFILTLPNA